MITSSVIACIRGARAKGLLTGQRSISRSAAAAIICVYWSIASPWKGGSSSLRWRMWRGPTAVRTELDPTIGRNGDSPVSDGASSGFAVKSERTWSGWLVMTGPPGIMPRIRKTSPSWRRARKTNWIWRWLKRSVCSSGDPSIAGGSGRPCASAASIGPAGEAGASPTCVSSGSCGVSTVMNNGG